MSNTKLKFKDIPKGEAILFNGQYAIKINSKRLLLSCYGADGFIEIDEEREFEVIEEEDNDETGK
jgi:hypothetical protein